MDDRLIGRAGFLGILAAGVAGVVWGRDITRFAGRLVPDAVPAVGPSGGWRIYTIGDRIPTIDPAAYRLRIDGLVERPLSLMLDDLRALPRAEQVSDFKCVTGWSVQDVRWAGVRFGDILEAAGPKPEARWLGFISDEVPYTDTLSLEQALLSGRDARAGHGRPAAFAAARRPRPGRHAGDVRLQERQWVTRIEVRRDFVRGYWETHGYDSDAWIGRSNGFSS